MQEFSRKLSHGFEPTARVRDHGGNWEQRKAGITPIALRWACLMCPTESDWFCDQSPWKLLSLVWEKIPTEYIRSAEDQEAMTRQCIRHMLEAQLWFWKDVFEAQAGMGFDIDPGVDLLTSNNNWRWCTKYTIHLWSLNPNGYCHPSAQPRFTVHGGNAYPVCLRAVSREVERWIDKREAVVPEVTEKHVDWVMRHLTYPQPCLPGVGR